MMRAVVTGASGFLGGRLAQMLAARGDEVTILARPTSDLRHLDSTPIRLVQGDLRDEESLRKAVQGATHIFHCAACSTDWAPLETYIAANVTGTRSLLDAALGVPTLERFLHVSTTDVYGYPEAPCGEDGPLVGTGLPYNRTKLQGELAVSSAGKEHGLPVTIVRPGTIYGPRGKDFTIDMAALLRQRMMAVVDGGVAPGGFAYVDNAAQAMIAAALSPNTIGQAYNLVDGTAATWRQYLTIFAELLGTKVPWIDLSFRSAMALAGIMEAPHRFLGLRGKPLLTRHAVYLLGRDQEFPIEKARADFGFAPAIGLEEGLRRSAEWLTATSVAQSGRLHR
jgi:nucleoside-diphosphate-sugar epimerase